MVTETPPPDPDFDARFELPGTVQTNEEFSITLVIENNGGAGEFRSEVSYRYNQAEWQTYDEHLIEFVEAESTERIEGDQTSLSYPGTYQFRLEATDQTSTVSVERPQEYQLDYARANAKSPSYDTLFRQFETYQGQPIHFLYASVYQVIYDWDEERDLDYMQMSVINNKQGYQGDIAVLWGGNGRILEDDVLEIWGVAEQLYEYETVQGDTRTIPRITLVDYDIRESN